MVGTAPSGAAEVAAGRRMYFILVSPGEGAAPEYNGYVVCTEEELQDYQTMLWQTAREAGVPCVYVTLAETTMLTDRGLVRWGPMAQAPGGYTEQDLRNTLRAKVARWREAGFLADERAG